MEVDELTAEIAPVLAGILGSSEEGKRDRPLLLCGVVIEKGEARAEPRRISHPERRSALVRCGCPRSLQDWSEHCL